MTTRCAVSAADGESWRPGAAGCGDPPPPPACRALSVASNRFPRRRLFSFVVFFFLPPSPPPRSWYLKCGLRQVERCIAKHRSWFKVDWVVFLCVLLLLWFFFFFKIIIFNLNDSWLWMQRWQVLQVKGFQRFFPEMGLNR